MAVTSKYRVMSDDGDSDHEIPPPHALFPVSDTSERLKKNTTSGSFDVRHLKQAKF